MLKTEVRKALTGYEYTRIKQTDGVVHVTFEYILSQTEKDLMKQALKTLIHKGTCNNIYVSLLEHRAYTHLFVHKGDNYRKNPSVFYENM